MLIRWRQRRSLQGKQFGVGAPQGDDDSGVDDRPGFLVATDDARAAPAKLQALLEHDPNRAGRATLGHCLFSIAETAPLAASCSNSLRQTPWMLQRLKRFKMVVRGP